MPDSAEQIIDELLVLDAQNGQREAFDMLVSRWHKRLWAHSFRLTGNADAAWDITQESWLHIVRGLKRLDDPAKFGSWAYRIITNKTYDWLKRHGRVEALAEPDETPAPAASDTNENRDDIRHILDRLPANSQTVLKLYYLDGFDLREIAAILKTPAGTIKSRLHTARIEFRKHWESLAGLPAVPASPKEKHHA